jgi:hypothetical protein
MKTLLFVFLFTAPPVQDDVAERVRLSKIKDVERAKIDIKRVAPPFVNDAVKMAYYEGKETKEAEVVRYSAFRPLVVEIDDDLKAPEVLLKAVARPDQYPTTECLKRITQTCPAYRSRKRRIKETTANLKSVRIKIVSLRLADKLCVIPNCADPESTRSSDSARAPGAALRERAV